MFRKNGLTTMELILALVIVSILSALAYPRLMNSVENGNAKQALETLRAISQAARLYHSDHSGQYPANLSDLETTKYVQADEYAKGYTYEFSPPSAPGSGYFVTASRNEGSRQIKLGSHSGNSASDGQVEDSAHFLDQEEEQA